MNFRVNEYLSLVGLLRMEPRLFTIEGADGSGKTTLLNELKKRLDKEYGRNSYIIAKDPSTTGICKKIREILVLREEEKLNKYAELMLFNAARAQLTHNTILPALEEGKIVLCDRYFDSSFVYQCIASYHSTVQLLIDMHYCKIPRPIKTFILSISTETSMKRAQKQYYETLGYEFAAKVVDAYKTLADYDTSNRIVKINGEMEKEAIADIAFATIQQTINR